MPDPIPLASITSSSFREDETAPRPYQVFVKSVVTRFGVGPAGVPEFSDLGPFRGAYGVARALGASPVEAYAVSAALRRAQGDFGNVVTALLKILECQRHDTSETRKLCTIHRLADSILAGTPLGADEEHYLATRGIDLGREYRDWSSELQQRLTPLMRSEHWLIDVADCQGIRHKVQVPDLDMVYVRLLRQLARLAGAPNTPIDIVQVTYMAGEPGCIVLDAVGVGEMIAQYEYRRSMIVDYAAEVIRCPDDGGRLHLIESMSEMLK